MNIITLTLSPAIDLHISSPKFERGVYNSATVVRRDIGGKGINLSRALLASGTPSTAVAVFGEEDTEPYWDILAASGMQMRCAFTKGKTRENINIHHDGGDTVIAPDGPPLPASVIDKVSEIVFQTADEKSAVVFSGRISSGTDREAVLAMLFRLKEQGVKLVIDSKSLELEEIVALKPYLIKPNAEEAELLTGIEVSNEDDTVKAALAISELGVERVLLTAGGGSAVLVSEKEVYIARPPRLVPVSTVGAGDSTIAGFLAGKRGGASDLDAFRLAIAFGSAACLTEGSLPPDPCKIKELISDVQITVINK